MEVIAYDPYVSAGAAAVAGARSVEREELFRASDVLSMNMVLTQETRHFVSSVELALMKPTALLANCSRGPVVDETALVAALRAGTIAGAVIDVFEVDPPAADNPLFELDNVLLMPHLAGCTDYGYHEIGALTAELVERYFNCEPIPRPSVVVETPRLIVQAPVAAPSARRPRGCRRGWPAGSRWSLAPGPGSAAPAPAGWPPRGLPSSSPT